MCWKRTGILLRTSVPSKRLPGVVTTATASVPDGCPSGFDTSAEVKWPEYPATQIACFLGTSRDSRP